MKSLTLNTGVSIPSIGLGTYRFFAENDGYDAVKTALEAGYTHIDTASAYENEEIVGRAIKDFMEETGTPRSKFFITTKLWCDEVQDAEGALRRSLKRLQLDYVDLYLIHWPVALAQKDPNTPSKTDGSGPVLPYSEWSYIDTYRSLQKLLPLGLTKAIGISNFNIAKIEHLLNDPEVTVTPAVLQVELHPYLPQFELIEYCKSKSIAVEAFAPLGSNGAPLLKEPVLVKLAEKYNVSPATIAISWGVNRDTILLPKSANPQRVVSNLHTIELSAEDMQLINDISKTTHKRLIDLDWGVDIFGSGATY